MQIFFRLKYLMITLLETYFANNIIGAVFVHHISMQSN